MLCRCMVVAAAMWAAAPCAPAASISGTILPPGKAKGVKAFEREAAELFKINNRYHNGTLDAKTGKFEIANLPDGTYQLLIDCGAAKIEGVDLRIDDEEDGPVFDYVFKTKASSVERLDLSRYFDADEVIDAARRSKIIGKVMGIPKLIEKLDSVRQVDRFCEHVRPLAAHGTRQRAFVLVEKARLKSFYAGSGQAIYRVEIWQFNRVGPIWDKPTKGVRVLQRHRFKTQGELQRLGVLFEPRLGGIQVLKGKSVTDIEYTIPAKWDDAMGKVPGRPVAGSPSR
jgi:hypothetical protein